MDPLSGVLSLLKPQNSMCGGFDVGAATGHSSSPSMKASSVTPSFPAIAGLLSKAFPTRFS